MGVFCDDGFDASSSFAVHWLTVADDTLAFNTMCLPLWRWRRNAMIVSNIFASTGNSCQVSLREHLANRGVVTPVLPIGYEWTIG